MNRDMVVKSINGCINNGEYCNECAYEGCIHRNGSCERDLLADALELIENLEERLAIVLEGQPEIVRCKECKYAKDYTHAFRTRPYMCQKTDEFQYRDGNFFCADGESRGEDDG